MGSSETPERIASPRGLTRAINIAVMMWSTFMGLPPVRSGTFAAQSPPLRVKLTQERSGFGIRGFLTRSTRLPEVRTKLDSQQHIHLHSDPSLDSRRALIPLPRMAGRLVSSGTLGFCFIFCFLFSYDGTFTRVFRPMQGSPRTLTRKPDLIMSQIVILSEGGIAHQYKTRHSFRMARWENPVKNEL